MAHELASTLLDWLRTIAPAFTKPGFGNALVIILGWIQICGGHAVTGALVATGVAGRRHHAAYHRFFTRGAWSPDAVGQLLFAGVLKFLAKNAVLDLVLDDTMAPHRGPKMFGVSAHLDAVRSTKKHRVFAFGHVWVTLSVVLKLPFSRRPWALPVLFRLYRTKKDCARRRGTYKTKTELGREMLGVLASWLGDRHARVAFDGAYSNSTVIRGLPAAIQVVGAMRPDAVLTSVPAAHSGRGRRRVRGELLPSPGQLFKRTSMPWQRCTAVLYGRKQTVHYKTIDAQWYRVTGPALVRVVVVRVDHGKCDYRVFFSTDLSLTVVEILESYAGRWATEVCYRDLKQEFGFADSQARKRAAVERTAPLVGCAYTAVVLWFADGAYKSPLAAPPTRPWYRTKRGHSLADILACTRRILAGVDVLDPRRSIDELPKMATSCLDRSGEEIRAAA